MCQAVEEDARLLRERDSEVSLVPSWMNTEFIDIASSRFLSYDQRAHLAERSLVPTDEKAYFLWRFPSRSKGAGGRSHQVFSDPMEGLHRVCAPHAQRVRLEKRETPAVRSIRWCERTPWDGRASGRAAATASGSLCDCQRLQASVIPADPCVRQLGAPEESERLKASG